MSAVVVANIDCTSAIVRPAVCRRWDRFSLWSVFNHLCDRNDYLAAHALCNNYRSDYGSEEFQWILKIGVWARRQMETNAALGEAMLGVLRLRSTTPRQAPRQALETAGAQGWRSAERNGSK